MRIQPVQISATLVFVALVFLALAVTAAVRGDAAATICLAAALPTLPGARRDDDEGPVPFRGLVDHAPVGIVIHGIDRISYANEAAARLVNVEPSALAGRPVDDFLDEPVRDAAREQLRRILAGEAGTGPGFFSLRRPDGAVREVAVSTLRHETADGPELVSYLRDVTEEVQTRRELAVSRERLSLALEASRDGVWDWDLRSDRMFYNRNWCRMLGLAPEDVAPDRTTWLRLINPDDRPLVERRLLAHLRGDTPLYEAEVRLRHADGHEIWVLDRGRVVARDENGAPLRMTGTHHDISESRRAAEMLALRHAVAEVFLVASRQSALPRLLEILGASFGCPGAFLLWSDAGSPVHVEAVRRDAHEAAAHVGEPLASPPALLARCLAGEIVAAEDVALPPSLGGPARRMLAVPVSAGPEACGLLALLDRGHPFDRRDAERLAAISDYLAPILHGFRTAELRERQLRQAQKMEALGVLAGGIAHDFNNILQAIMGFTSLAREDAGPDERVEADLERVMRAARRGRDLVQRIVQFSRREEQAFAPVDLAAVLREAAGLLRSTTRAAVVIDCDVPDEPAWVSGDISQLSQAVMNLAANALQAMGPDGGDLRMVLTRVTADRIPGIAEPSAAPYHAVHIHDSGPGLSPQIRERAFDPFFTTKSVGVGTGLGLAVVHGIVTAHGGVVDLSDRPGGGATASIYLPSDAGRAVGDAPSAAAIAPLEILFLDDEDDIAILGGHMLSRGGHRVTALTDPQEAWRLLAEDPRRWDLVVSDLSMPGLSGIQLAARLAGLRSDLPVILITGAGEADATLPATSDNVRCVVRKPFAREALESAVRRAVAPPAGPPAPDGG